MLGHRVLGQYCSLVLVHVLQHCRFGVPHCVHARGMVGVCSSVCTAIPAIRYASTVQNKAVLCNIRQYCTRHSSLQYASTLSAHVMLEPLHLLL
eukprot:1177671-Rhodomonas_salina.2